MPSCISRPKVMSSFIITSLVISQCPHVLAEVDALVSASGYDVVQAKGTFASHQGHIKTRYQYLTSVYVPCYWFNSYFLRHSVSQSLIVCFATSSMMLYSNSSRATSSSNWRLFRMSTDLKIESTSQESMNEEVNKWMNSQSKKECMSDSMKERMNEGVYE